MLEMLPVVQWCKKCHLLLLLSTGGIFVFQRCEVNNIAILVAAVFSGSAFSRRWPSKPATTASTSLRLSPSFPAHLTPRPGQRNRHKARRSPPWLPARDCWRCGRSFATAQQRQQHARAAHSGLLPFSCTFCWRRFSQLSYLRVHKMQHAAKQWRWQQTWLFVFIVGTLALFLVLCFDICLFASIFSTVVQNLGGFWNSSCY